MKSARVLNLAGLLGVAFIVAGMMISAFAYRGTHGEPYRLANHFVSELGETGVSNAAWAFNAGLIVGGISIIVFVIGLVMRLSGWFRSLFLSVGLITGICATLVGVFPMNHLRMHMWVANGFFYPGLVSMLLFSVYVLLNRSGELPRLLALPGLVAAASLFSFLFLGGLLEAGVNGDALPGFGADRPAVWVSAILEWIAIGAVLGWIAIVAGIIAVRDVRR